MRTDPASLEILRSHFYAIAEGMGHILERTSYTTFVKESADFATALATPDGEFFVYPRTVGVTIFLGLNVKKAADACAPLEPGDVIVTNDPYSTDGLATHLPDVHVIQPVFVGGRLLAYAWSFAHLSDVGGLVPGSIAPSATDVHQEGLRIPPVKIYRRGEPNGDVRTLFMANSRIPDLNWGDLNAMVAAVHSGDIRLRAMAEKFGRQPVADAVADLLQQQETRARQVIARIPDGTYSFADYLDDEMISDVPVRLAVRATVAGDEITLDFSDCDPQTSSAFNLASQGTKHPFLFQGLINYIITSDPFIPVGGGITRPVHVVVPAGSVVHAQYPAAVGIRHAITMRLYNVVLGALAQALPEAVPAAGAGQAAIVVLSTPEQRTGRRRVAVIEPMGGGGGGQSGADGIDGIDHAAGFLQNTPVESVEQHVDTLVHRYELLPGTAGPGLHRGGHAVRLDFEIVRPGSVVTARGVQRTRFHPWGLAGGRPGALGSVLVNPDGLSPRRLAGIDVLTPEPGDVISFRSPGGGGWGDPLARDPALVAEEVAAGLLSMAQAREAYGVVLQERAGAPDARWRVDAEATVELRLRMASSSRRAAARYDLGPARAAYERRWTPEASTRLARLLMDLPAARRGYLKRRVHALAERLPQGRPLDERAVTDILREAQEDTIGRARA